MPPKRGDNSAADRSSKSGLDRLKPKTALGFSGFSNASPNLADRKEGLVHFGRHFFGRDDISRCSCLLQHWEGGPSRIVQAKHGQFA